MLKNQYIGNIKKAAEWPLLIFLFRLNDPDRFYSWLILYRQAKTNSGNSIPILCVFVLVCF
ncbi:MAG: hypothetical protein EBS24_00255 [Chitinophagia bacterium]|nr:hypothetical protein [Chitinophagia bacterium]